MSHVPIDQLKTLAEFALLAEGQQRFLEAYIANGYNREAATVSAYPKAKTPESIRVMGARIMNSPGMVMMLALHFGDDPKDSFCKMVAKMVIRGRISKEQESLIRLLAQTRGFIEPWTPRYEKQIKAGMANNRQAVKRRVQRAAKTAAIRKEAENVKPEGLLNDFR